jgi:hypothetical protein
MIRWHQQTFLVSECRVTESGSPSEPKNPTLLTSRRMEPPRNGFKLHAMTFVNEKDLQEKERKVYSPEYHFGPSWTPTTNMAYSKLDTKSLKNNTYMSEGAYCFGLPGLAIGGVLWLDNNRIFFTDLRKGQISTLRLRVSQNLPFCALGVYWLPREERLIIHDIYKYGGQNVWAGMNFSDRWSLIGQVVNMIRQDTSLQGFALEMADLRSITGVIEERADTEILVIQPQRAGARSFRIHGFPVAAAAAAEPVDEVPSVVGGPTMNTTASLLWILKDTIRSGPEAYILVDESGESCGVPAIQGLAVSQAIRVGLVKERRLRVKVRWNVHFGRYEVLGGPV